MTDTNQATPTATVKLTATEKLLKRINQLVERINADTEQYNTLKADYEALQAVANVQAGDRVNATVGRGEKAVVIEGGLVLGVSDTDTGKAIKVTVGSGFDTQVYVLSAGQVTSVSKPVEEAVAEQEEQADA